MKSAVSVVLEEELSRVAAAHRGHLRAPDVVAAARPPESPLHRYFEWNEHRNSEAHLLQQARQLIARVTVVYPVPGTRKGIETRKFISLPSDRIAGTGYQKTVVVMSHEDTRLEYIRNALNELRRFRQQYYEILKLASAFTDLDALKEKLSSLQ